MEIKRAFFLTLAVSSLFLSSCKDNKTVQFNLIYAAPMTIPATNGIDLPINVESEAVETEITDRTNENKTTPELLTSVVPSNVHLSLVSPENSALSFFGDIKVYINADGLTEKLISTNENASAASISSVPTTVKNVDITEFVKKPNFKIRLNFTPDDFSNIQQEIEVRLTLATKGDEL